MSRTLVTIRSDDTLLTVRQWIASRAAGSSHQGFPVLDDKDHLVGVVTRRQLLDPDIPAWQRLIELINRPPKFAYDDASLRSAADHMVNHDIGRLPVIERRSGRVIGMITRSDLLGAHRQRLREHHEAEQGLLT